MRWDKQSQSSGLRRWPILLPLLWASFARGELTSLSWVAEQNLLSAVGGVLANEEGHVSGCTFEPSFDVATHFYLVKCARAVVSVTFEPKGEHLYANGRNVSQNAPLEVKVPDAKAPNLVTLNSCPAAIPTLGADFPPRGSDFSSCKTYHFDVFRVGDDETELASLGVSSSELMMMSPEFSPKHHTYVTTVAMGANFSISAVSKQPLGLVGIEFVGDPAASGLMGQTGCDLASKRSEMWNIPGWKATGEYQYRICCVAPNMINVVRYNLTVKVTPLYSAMLRNISVGSYQLVPPFESDTQTYHALIPKHVSDVKISAISEDKQAALRFTEAGRHSHKRVDEESVQRGSANQTVKMHLNEHLGLSETPRWTRTVSISVQSADDRETMTYVITLKTDVSKFSYLKNITVGDDTNCVLTPPFQPDIIDYKCWWWWEDKTSHAEMKVGAIIPHMDTENCSHCYMLAPADDGQSSFHLSYRPEDAKRIHWDDGKTWNRKFLYGEQHKIPFQVVSEDKFTSTIYWVEMRRNCPWWMTTALTRQVSQWATTLAIFMAYTSVTNLRQLAQQVQFMTLTTEIQGSPVVFRDFTEGLKSVNLDFASWIPWSRLGLPTKHKLEEMKHKMIKYIAKELKIENAHLLVQYCAARKYKPEDGLLYPNAILLQDPECSDRMAKVLPDQLTVGATTSGHASTMAVATTTTQAVKDADAAKTATRHAHNQTTRKKNATSDAKKKNATRHGHNQTTGKEHATSAEVERNHEEEEVSKRRLHNNVFLLAELAGDDAAVSDRDSDRNGVALRGNNRKHRSGLLSEDLYSEFDDDDWDEAEFTSPGRRLKEAKLIKAMIPREKDYHDLLKKAKKEGYTHSELRKRFTAIDCSSQAIQDVIMVLTPIEQGFHLKEMMMSTAGTFMLLAFLITVCGALYLIIFFFVLHGKQKRLRVLEPGPLWIFLLDYTLILFAKSASKVAFNPKRLHFAPFLKYSPPKLVTQRVSAFGLFTYPFFFVLGMWVKIWNMMTRHMLVWNPKQEAYSDPRAQNVKVTYTAEVFPSWIPIHKAPVVSTVLTIHLRNCIPVVDEEGEPIDFAQTSSQGDRKKEASQLTGKEEVTQKVWQHEIEDELQKLKTSQQKAADRQRFIRLEEEKENMEEDKRIKEAHVQKMLEKKAKQLTDEQRQNAVIQKDPPWFGKVFDDYVPPKEDDTFKAQSLVTMIDDSFKTRKNRGNLERLTREERFAMLQWIDDHIRREKKLHQYSILKVKVIDGYLKPWEPLKNTQTQSARSRSSQQIETGGDWRPWLSDAKKYRVPETPWPENATQIDPPGWPPKENDLQWAKYREQMWGHVPELMDFTEKLDVYGQENNYIENEIGQRLVYQGNDGLGPNGKRNYCFECFVSLLPGGAYGGRCMWMDEPEEEWNNWYNKQLQAGKGQKGLRFADKWQWLYYNEDQPWTADDDDEGKIRICCQNVTRKELFFWSELRKWLLKRWKWRVPYRLVGREKVEMRKWLWKELLERSKLKIKIGYMADQHPKFYNGDRTVAEIAETDFDEIWRMIDNARPILENLLPREKQIGNFNTQNELQEFTLMRVEDTYGYDEEEPWNDAVDPSGKSELKVQFDTDHFWQKFGDTELELVRKECPLIPKHGYSTCSAFTKKPDVQVAVKRYTLHKPDNSCCNVVVNVKMKHILPLMRYTHGFKMNVQQSALDLPCKDTFSLILGNKKVGEQYNYIVERVTTLISIIILAWDPSGIWCALGFLVSKTLSWVVQLFACYLGKKYQDVADHAEGLPDNAAANAGTDAGDTLLDSKKPKLKSGRQLLREAFFDNDVFKELLQDIILILLFCMYCGLIPAPLCAIYCIFVCCFTMLYMNAATFLKELQKYFAAISDFINSCLAAYRTFENRAKDFLNGNNWFGFQFYAFTTIGDKTQNASKISFVIPELGVTLDGKTDVPPGLSPEEQREWSVGKTVVHHMMNTDADDTRLNGAHQHVRWERDVLNGLTVSLDIDQMLHRKRQPRIVATIQCLNHSESSASSPQFDSYLTLSKQLPGETWEDEYDHDKDKQEKLLNHWLGQVNQWLVKTLGAIESDKTATASIKEELRQLLELEVYGSTERNIYKINLHNLEIPLTGSWDMPDLHKKLGFVRVLYEHEHVTTSFPTSRLSGYGIFKKFDPKDGKRSPCYRLEFPESESPDAKAGEFDVEIPHGVGCVKFTIWAQDEKHKSEELVGFTDDITVQDIQNPRVPDIYPQLIMEGEVSFKSDGLTTDEIKQAATRVISQELRLTQLGMETNALEVDVKILTAGNVTYKASGAGTGTSGGGSSVGNAKVLTEAVKHVLQESPEGEMGCTLHVASATPPKSDGEGTFTFTANGMDQQQIKAHVKKALANQMCVPELAIEVKVECSTSGELNFKVQSEVIDYRKAEQLAESSQKVMEGKNLEGSIKKNLNLTSNGARKFETTAVQYHPPTGMTTPIKVYSKWWLRGVRISPFGGKHLTDDQRQKEKAKEEALEAQRGCWERFKAGIARWYESLNMPSEDAIKRSRGEMIVAARKFNLDEKERDMEVVRNIEELAEGETMNFEKLKRHKDRWLLLAAFVGVYPVEKNIEKMKEHLAAMRVVQQKLDETDSKNTMQGNVQKLYKDIAAMEEDIMQYRQKSASFFKQNAKISASKASSVREKSKETLRKKKKTLMNLEYELQSGTSDVAHEKQTFLARRAMRRTLGQGTNMVKSINRFEKDIQRAEAVMRRDAQMFRTENVQPIRIRELKKRTISGNVVTDPARLNQMRNRSKRKGWCSWWCCDEAKEQAEDDGLHGSIFADELLDKLWEYQAEQLRVAKQILHYVIMSEQLKPNKQWRPDPITPHVATILSGRSPPDMTEVTFSIKENGTDAKTSFARESVLVHGRLCFHTTRKIYVADDGGLQWKKGEDPKADPDEAAKWKILFLYWDGRSKWVISPTRGAPPPYGLASDLVRGFMWVQDGALSPDEIGKSRHGEQQAWNSWNDTTKAWEKIPSARVAGQLAVGTGMRSAAKTKKDRVLTEAVDVHEEEPGVCGELLSELASFMTSGETFMSEENKDCLVSLTADAIHFSWKDDSIERLAPFRRFLLTEFGTYAQAWVYMTRSMTFKTALGQKNLALIFRESYEAIKYELEKEDEYDSDDDIQSMATELINVNNEEAPPMSSATASIIRKKTRKRRETFGKEPKPRVLERLGTKIQVTNAAQTNKKQSITGGRMKTAFQNIPDTVNVCPFQRLKELQEFLHDWMEKPDEDNPNEETRDPFQNMAAQIIQLMDKDGDGDVCFQEVKNLFDDEEKDKMEDSMLKDFANWLAKHPWYENHLENFWAELSEGLAIGIEEFTRNMRSVLLKFAHDKGSFRRLGMSMSVTGVEDHCQVLDANWAPLPETLLRNPGMDKTKRDLILRFRVQGQNALNIYEKHRTWTISVAGHAGEYLPEENEKEFSNKVQLQVSKITGDVLPSQSCSLTYRDVVFGRTIYFQYGKDRSIGQRYTHVSFKATNPSAPEDKAHQIFAALDDNRSGTISRNELVPKSGDQLADVERSMVTYDVPLSEIGSMMRGVNVPGQEDQRVVKLKVNPTFANGPHWSELRLALNPEWECHDQEQADQEEIKFMMHPSFWRLWRSSIQECKMNEAQLWVRFYDGGYLEHPILSGVFVRHGMGIQRWASGQVYEGNWQNHVYDGEGKLWAKSEDYSKGEPTATPLYTGSWKAGHRDGNGVLIWEQDKYSFQALNKSRVGKTIGLRKCYTGEFKNGFFHGKGMLVMTDAVPQVLPSTDPHRGLRKVPAPQLHPEQMLKFTGEFSSNWMSVYSKVKREKLAEHWMKAHENDFPKLLDDADKPFLFIRTVDNDPEVEGSEPTNDHEIDPDLKLQTLAGGDTISRQRMQRYLGVKAKETQRAGKPVPDLALLFYSLKLNDNIPAECLHMVRGVARYADGCQYSGDFRKGRPHGQGTLHQFERDKITIMIEYKGEWHEGDRTGKGEYRYWCSKDGALPPSTPTSRPSPQRGAGAGMLTDGTETEGGVSRAPSNAEFRASRTTGYTYNGDFLKGQRHGLGVQEVKEVLLEEFGYSKYDGAWENDMRHGGGTMWMPGESGPPYVFTGTFVQGWRQGYGLLKREGDQTILYNGLWKDDCICTNTGDHAWSHVDDFYYFGEFGVDGTRQGEGILFKASPDMVPRFKKAMEDTTSGASRQPPQGSEACQVYKGQWRNNQYHGKGEQFFDTGKYDGDFKKGQRHGRGTWESYGKDKAAKWFYRPVRRDRQGEGEGPTNWDHNLMHGIAIVEDEKHVHENVLFKQGEAQMPWTKEGPPTTGVDLSAMRIMGVRVRHKPDDAPVTLSETSKLHGTAASNNRNNPDHVAATPAHALQVLVRQPTDLEIPEEDIWITGGTGGNEVMNGVYFKMHGTFGVPIYRMVKRTLVANEGGFLRMLGARSLMASGLQSPQVAARYLYRHTNEEYWLISDSPERQGHERHMKHWAYVRSHASTPGDIESDADWYVWHEELGRMCLQSEVGQMVSKNCSRVEASPVDRITIRAIGGYEVTGLDVSGSDVTASFLMRYPGQFFRRPVYESNRADMYLFWIEDGGNIDEGDLLEEEYDSPADMVKSEETLFKKLGYWVLASDMPRKQVDWKSEVAKKANGFPHDDLMAIAWVKELAVTPDQIDPRRKWLVKDEKKNPPFRENAEMKVRPEEITSLARRVPAAVHSRVQSRGGNSRATSASNSRSRRDDELALVSNPQHIFPLMKIAGLDD